MLLEKIQYKLTKSKDGLDTIVIIRDNTEIPLHSKFSPAKESEILKDKFIPEKYDFLIVLGIGLGYHLLTLKNYIPRYSKIILIDILNDLQEKISHNELTSFLTGTDKIIMLSGRSIIEIEDILSELINMDESKGISVLEHPASIRLFSEYYNDIKKTIEKVINKKAGNKATKGKFGLLYLKNILKNIRNISNLKSVKHFFNQFQQYPVIIITSGPSLENYIETIRRFQNRFFLIAVDSAFPALYKNNIMPDFVISIDPQPYIYEHFSDTSMIDTIPIFSISVYPALTKKYKGLIFLNSHPISQIIAAYDDMGSIDSFTGSVAGDALNFGIKLGFKAIALIGFNFSFIQYKIYSRGTAYQKRYSLFFQDRFSTVEKFNFDYIMKSSKGFKHSGKFTRRSFIQYKESLEDFIKKSEFTNLYNADNEGISIKGVRATNLNEFVTTYCTSEVDKKGIKDKLLSSIKCINSDILVNKLKVILSDNNLFDELLTESIDDNFDIRKRKKFTSMIRGLL